MKICGIRSPEDALVAAGSGADAIGLVFYPGSKRVVGLEQAQVIRKELPAFVSVVGLFVNAQADDVRRAQDRVHLDCLQFHGDEPASFCEQFGTPYIKALRVRQGEDPIPTAKQFSSASAILLDSYEAGQRGGTGKSFDWSVAARCVADLGIPIVLAGGLAPDNVARAIETVHPWAVDVSTGVESGPGIKCRMRMTEFFNEVYSVKPAATV